MRVGQTTGQMHGRGPLETDDRELVEEPTVHELAA